MALIANHNVVLVVLSYCISVFGSYTGLQLTSCIAGASAKAKPWWIGSAAVAIGGGAIWTMHFIGMLAYHIDMPVMYDLSLTFLSLVIAIVFVGLGIYLVSTGIYSITKLLFSGTLMGLGVAGMHYTGMYAMVMAATVTYDPTYFILSIVVSIIASIIALFLANITINNLYKFAAAFMMGAAVCGMHYTGMIGMTMTPIETTVSIASSIAPLTLGLIIFCFSMLLLVLSLIVALSQMQRRVYKDLEQSADPKFFDSV